MLFFDMDSASWTARPGSASPPTNIPVLTVGASHQISVKFVSSGTSTDVTGSTFYGGIKIKDDFAGTAVADDDGPEQNEDEAITFTFDLTTADAKAYFTANPTEDSAPAVFIVVATIDGIKIKTPPFEVMLQNDYFSDQ